jgi:hypothetical protein
VVRYTLAANSTPAETEIRLEGLRTLGHNTYLRTVDIGPATGAVISPPNIDGFDSEGHVQLGILELGQPNLIQALRIDTDTQEVTMQSNLDRICDAMKTTMR